MNKRDQYHSTALAAAASLGRAITTTIWVLIEVADALSNPGTRASAERFILEALQGEDFLLLSDTEPWFSRGLALYGQRQDKSWSLTDCISFVVMQERGIQDALTGDHHFAQAGFNPLLSLPEPA